MTGLRCVVVGGGIIGVAVARELSRRAGIADVTIYEKEQQLASHQTGHNSGVVHAGLYYEPGSMKAQLCRRGVSLLHEFCLEKSLPYDECGKVVVAQDERELLRLEAIFERASTNGVPGVRMLDEAELHAIEPNVVGIAALHSPHTAIVNYAEITRALAEDVLAAGGRVLLGNEVASVRNVSGGVVVATKSGEKHYDLAVVCGGLQSDRLARASGADPFPRIVPFFGSYRLLESQNRNIVNGLVYPVPDPNYPFLGVHLTKRVDGEMMVGPNAFISLGREAYAWHRINIRDLLAIFFFRGFWKFVAKNVTAAIREVRVVLSRRKFKAEAARHVPLLKKMALLPGTRGVRAQAMAANGDLVDDFVIQKIQQVTHVRNAPSPGATSSMAIAEYIADRVLHVAG